MLLVIVHKLCIYQSDLPVNSNCHFLVDGWRSSLWWFMNRVLWSLHFRIIHPTSIVPLLLRSHVYTPWIGLFRCVCEIVSSRHSRWPYIPSTKFLGMDSLTSKKMAVCFLKAKGHSRELSRSLLCAFQSSSVHSKINTKPSSKRDYPTCMSARWHITCYIVVTCGTLAVCRK